LTPQQLLDKRNNLFKIFGDTDRCLDFFESVNRIRYSVFSKYLSQLIYDRRVNMDLFYCKDNEILDLIDIKENCVEDEQIEAQRETATFKYRKYIDKEELKSHNETIKLDPIRYLDNFSRFLSVRDYFKSVSDAGYNCYMSGLLNPKDNTEKAYLCFITQMTMYYGATFYTEVNHGVPDLDKVPIFTCILILFFTFFIYFKCYDV